ncbi:MAG TPA: type IV pilus assembly protein PilM [Candidatus Paceibacterota bacterium]|nr:type IV pilus assembly protein PilM [Candidatus Paceibacterota bacterium]
MKLPSNPISSLENIASPLLRNGFIGIDIGTSSIKIVQLSLEGATVVLETYGEILLGPYGDRQAGRTAHLDPKRLSDAVLDLFGAVDATSRRCGIAIPVSSALVTFVKIPKRDPDQMRQILPLEAKQYVPIPIDDVVLDWAFISDEIPRENAFARVERNEPAQASIQNVMMVAIEKKTTEAYRAAIAGTGIAVEFYELELFGSVRSNMHTATGPALFMDIGASSTKLCITNGQGVPVGVHVVPLGGQAITEKIMQACGWHFDKAEDAKRAKSIATSTSYTEEERRAVATVIRDMLRQLFSEGSQLIKAAANEYDVDIGRVVLLGGGACLDDIAQSAAAHFDTKVEIADAFAKVRAPIIIEDVLREVGPKFAIAAGVALRGAAT